MLLPRETGIITCLSRVGTTQTQRHRRGAHTVEPITELALIIPVRNSGEKHTTKELTRSIQYIKHTRLQYVRDRGGGWGQVYRRMQRKTRGLMTNEPLTVCHAVVQADPGDQIHMRTFR